MSELISTQRTQETLRWRFLTTVSAVALTASVFGGQAACASNDDQDRPVVWIELGGQFDRLDGGQTPFAPPFFDAVTKGGFKSPLAIGRPAIYSNGFEGAISFMPDSSDWVFSGSVRYGRSGGHKFLHQQNPAQVKHFSSPGGGTKYRTANPNYAETKEVDSETHIIADFQAGKDVGLGMFGEGSTSIVGLGIRFAQFIAKSDITVRARPDVHFVPISGLTVSKTQFHVYFGSAQRAVSFQGLGPSISWNASTPLGGHPREGEVSLDWGINAAVLFGKQKARTRYQETGHFKSSPVNKYYASSYQRSGGHDDVRSVTVPNVGGFAGISVLYSNAKLSFGYRGDFFFGAIDGGLDLRKTYNREFYGPFASVSIGLGG